MLGGREKRGNGGGWKSAGGGDKVGVIILLIVVLNITGGLSGKIGLRALIFLVLLFAIIKALLKEQGVTLQQLIQGGKPFIQKVIKEAIAKKIKRRKNISIDEASTKTPGSEQVSSSRPKEGLTKKQISDLYNTNSLGGKNVLGKKANPFSLDGK